MDEQILRYSEMLLECYGIWSWCFDSQWHVKYTNSTMPTFHTRLLLEQGRKEAMAQQIETSTAPMILTDAMGFMYAAIGDRETAYVLGPVIPGNVSGEQIQTMLQPLKLSLKTKTEVMENIKVMPRVPTVAFYQHMIALNYFIRGEKCRISDIVYLTGSASVPKKYRGEEDEIPHSPVRNEQQLFEMVRTGNLEYQNALSAASAGSFGIRAKTTDPLQQAKYSVVAFITLCSRAAMEGGLSSEVAYALSDTYTTSIDACTSLSQVAAVSHIMYDDYIRRVNKCRRENGVSRPIRICCDHIDINPTGELSLRELAQLSGYTEYYLTRKFKKEMGVSLNEYIHNARIRHAKFLLTESPLSLHEIADQLHYCSRSYFTEVFQKAVGSTPAQYRANGTGQDA